MGLVSGTIDIPGLVELSGLAASRVRDDVLWALNDGGNEPLLYALGTDGRDLGSIRVAGVSNGDWEDIASLEIDGTPYLVIGDVGDNEAEREQVFLHFVREPEIRGDRLAKDAVVEVAWSVSFHYEDGPLDCESIAFDSHGGRVLLMSKRTNPVVVYEIPIASREDSVASRIVDRVNIPRITKKESRLLGALSRYATQPTAMDVSADGNLAIVQTYTDAFLFRRESGRTWADAFAARPERIRVPRMTQAEAVAFDRSGRALFVSGEGRPGPLIRIDAYLARSE